jgi:hypothetical protein
MAQLKDSTIDGNLSITGNVILKTNNRGIRSIHPETGEIMAVLNVSELGNTIIGYNGYTNQNGNSHIYGNDVSLFVASANNSNFRPYYRAGDTIDFAVRVSGYVTNSGKSVVFTIPITKPVIGTPKAIATSDSGFVLRQNNSYTHGSAASTYVKPTSYTVDSNYNSGFVVTAVFDVTTNVVNNSPIGIYWDGQITLS